MASFIIGFILLALPFKIFMFFGSAVVFLMIALLIFMAIAGVGYTAHYLYKKALGEDDKDESE